MNAVRHHDHADHGHADHGHGRHNHDPADTGDWRCAAALIGEAQAVAHRHSIGHTTLQLESEPLPDCPVC